MLRYMLTGLPPGVSYLEYLESQGTLLPLLKVRGRVRVSLSQQARKYDPNPQYPSQAVLRLARGKKAAAKAKKKVAFANTKPNPINLGLTLQQPSHYSPGPIAL